MMMKMPKDKRFLAAIVGIVLVMLVLYILLGYTVDKVPLPKFMLSGQDRKGKATTKEKFQNTKKTLKKQQKDAKEYRKENPGVPDLTPVKPLPGKSGDAFRSGKDEMKALKNANNIKIDPQDLIPDPDDAKKWNDANPVGTGTLADQNFLDAGFHVGVNSVGQSLRNANLQLRSEPANPVKDVSPWLNTTIDPELERRPLE